MAVQVAPLVIAAGQGAPGQQDAQVRADGLALINGQQERIRALEERVLQGQLQGAEAAQAYENQLFAVSQSRQAIAEQLAASQRQIEASNLLLQQRQAQVEELQRKQVQDAEQIAIGLREIGLLSAQVQQEREQVRLLTGQLEIAARQIEQLTAQMHRLEQMHRETLAMVQKQQKPQTSAIEEVASWALGLVWKAVRFHPPSDYHQM